MHFKDRKWKMPDQVFVQGVFFILHYLEPAFPKFSFLRWDLREESQG